ncbi:hypothetical protein TNCV_1016071 [Trichonephila clavipes]|uniref:Uncharacterized protein n=1 Tax=Trichonephila clavipes TaxID=2585209 RepID=A0A8X6VY72_TRICX|nr:hypothetical protein TNCV_1016071 [Trichonephila clavipes]
MVKKELETIDNRRSLYEKNPVTPTGVERMGLLNTGGAIDKCIQMLDKNYGTLGDGKRALDGENLERALKKRDLDGGEPRLGWKERRDPERRWRWRTRIQGLERFVLSDKGLI